jgi:hypothetical protein
VSEYKYAMSVCVRDPCVTFIDSIPGQAACEVAWNSGTLLTGPVKDLPITVNMIYTASNVAVQYLPKLTAGVGNVIAKETAPWVVKSIIALVLPYFIGLIVLTIILMRAHFLTIEVGVIFIVLIVSLVVIGFAFLYQDSVGVVSRINEDITNVLRTNFDKYSTELGLTLGQAIIAPDSLACLSTK